MSHNTWAWLFYAKLTSCSAEKNQKQSPLLRLPPELREEIYALSLTGARVISAWRRIVERKVSLNLDIHGLLMSCRQLRREALPYKCVLSSRLVRRAGPQLVAINCWPERNPEVAKYTLHRRQHVLGMALRTRYLLQFPRAPSFRGREHQHFICKGVLKYTLHKCIFGNSSQELEIQIGCELLATLARHNEEEKRTLVPESPGRKEG